jgi:hypothetical protein
LFFNNIMQNIEGMALQILVVKDEQSALDLYQFLFEEEGFRREGIPVIYKSFELDELLQNIRHLHWRCGVECDETARRCYLNRECGILCDGQRDPSLALRMTRGVAQLDKRDRLAKGLA